ncbi:hypothetical protein [Mycolicibacterium sp. F2034L]|uniref:hypothetical protein n=1 Tax=Mycolicibacterium sp. F2034L TaxID=2926422 RepID=UPI001FF62618|nr:hypothetical protein [Mycolicibacterium sp. F2034L]MCK0173345.1 hypothetical protein [Mycolicibacterium sp. F2034L]
MSRTDDRPDPADKSRTTGVTGGGQPPGRNDERADAADRRGVELRRQSRATTRVTDDDQPPPPRGSRITREVTTKPEPAPAPNALELLRRSSPPTSEPRTATSTLVSPAPPIPADTPGLPAAGALLSVTVGSSRRAGETVSEYSRLTEGPDDSASFATPAEPVQPLPLSAYRALPGYISVEVSQPIIGWSSDDITQGYWDPSKPCEGSIICAITSWGPAKVTQLSEYSWEAPYVNPFRIIFDPAFRYEADRVETALWQERYPDGLVPEIYIFEYAGDIENVRSVRLFPVGTTWSSNHNEWIWQAFVPGTFPAELLTHPPVGTPGEGDGDGDGTPDEEEPDTDGDGTPDDQDPDTDGDGTPDEEEPDTDGDGTPDDLDPVYEFPVNTPIDPNGSGVWDPVADVADPTDAEDTEEFIEDQLENFIDTLDVVPFAGHFLHGVMIGANFAQFLEALLSGDREDARDEAGDLAGDIAGALFPWPINAVMDDVVEYFTLGLVDILLPAPRD